MSPNLPGGVLWLILAAILIPLFILRGVRPRKLNIKRMWIAPSLLLFFALLAVLVQRPQSLGGTILCVAAAALGCSMGWLRGRFMTINHDPETGELTSKASAMAMLVILGIGGLRYILRTYLGQGAGLIHASVIDITDAFLLMAVGLLCTQRLEMWLRARKLMAEPVSPPTPVPET